MSNRYFQDVQSNNCWLPTKVIPHPVLLFLMGHKAFLVDHRSLDRVWRISTHCKCLHQNRGFWHIVLHGACAMWHFWDRIQSIGQHSYVELGKAGLLSENRSTPLRPKQTHFNTRALSWHMVDVFLKPSIIKTLFKSPSSSPFRTITPHICLAQPARIRTEPQENSNRTRQNVEPNLVACFPLITRPLSHSTINVKEIRNT